MSSILKTYNRKKISFKKDKGSYLEENWKVLAQNNMIQFIDSKDEFLPGVNLFISNGHTTGMMHPIITDNSNHYKLIKKGDDRELIQAIEDLKKVDRQSMQDEIWEKHSFEKWKTHIEDAMKKTIEAAIKNDKFISCHLVNLEKEQLALLLK